ncbi:MAG: SusC/RagA family TonB-linked outer membrane protein [Chitinophagales bacterium]|nr:SusC/RagA family TonB-linked outer membrane protein [Chitinophagales bacterium]MDW8427484.1 SusC/RagA family TonB-linked outer membrane protein [Chitinophagales bacterium]
MSKLLGCSNVLFALLFICLNVHGQTGSLRGQITDDKGEPVGFATVVLKGTSLGASADEEGNYQIVSVPAGEYTLVVSMIGYAEHSQRIQIGAGQFLTVNVTLKADFIGLDEVVVVGYGTRQVKDLTGSITSISAKDFNTGIVPTPEQLVQGKIAGVQIVSNDGAPGSGSRIRIRGGTSINASNDPLIVIDGVPIDNNGIPGSANPLNLINPNDIESITVLKDASAAAIYGNRAANGVILITTKKSVAHDQLTATFSTNTSVSHIVKYAPVLSADEFRTLVQTNGTDKQKSLLGPASTDWQKQIYRLGFASDNNLTFSGGLAQIPYRMNLEYFRNEGILKRDAFTRLGSTVYLAPSFLYNTLTVTVNGKFYRTMNFFADRGAIGSAVTFDPTQPVYSDTAYLGGYFEWLDPSTGLPNVLAPKNPVGLLYQKEDESQVNRILGNIQLDYRLPWVEGLRAHLNLGGDWSRSEGTVFIPETAASAYYRKGVDNQYNSRNNNKLLEFYVNYAKEMPAASSKFDLTAGYSYQDWLRSSDAFPDLNVEGDTISPPGVPFKTQNTLISFYGRLNYTLLERYLLTATLRDDGSSRFSPDTRWGLFPSFAIGWRISEEPFIRDLNVFSNLKLRLGWGVTGQQDIFNDYPYIANYSMGTSTAQYQFGDQFYYVLRPDGYDANIRWEQTATTNIGVDFGFLKGRINGSADYYLKKTTDLLAVIPVPAGTNFTNQILTNVGSMENEGVELSLNFIPIDQRDLKWEFSLNATRNINTVTKLTKVPDTTNIGILVGGISGGIGNTIQIHSVGYPVFSFYVFEQLYDENGKPIVPTGNAIADTAAFRDRNGDGRITPDDRYRYEDPAPDWYLGFSTNASYKRWTASFGLRASLGNYVYNNVNAERGTYAFVDGSKNYINNLVQDYYNTQFQKNPIYQFQSDYYVENASFLRMDYLTIGYRIGEVIKDRLWMNVSATVQNVFVLTGYSGIDPEVVGGIDNNIYPRPRIYSLNLSLNL